MRSPLIDALRILAISCVVIGHVGNAIGWTVGTITYSPLYNFALQKYGVTLFLILSGISLALSKPRPLMEFYRQRVARLFPVYWMGYLLYVAVETAAHHRPWPHSLSEAFLTLTGTCSLAGEWGCQFTVGWYIGLILSLYVLYPLLNRWITALPYTTIGVLFAVSLASRWITPSYLPAEPTDWFVLCRLFEFGLGVFLVRTSLIAPLLRVSLPASNALRYLGELSFPVYLVHWSFLPLFWHISSRPLAWLIYLSITLILSHAVLVCDRWLKHSTPAIHHGNRPSDTALRSGRPATT